MCITFSKEGEEKRRIIGNEQMTIDGRKDKGLLNLFNQLNHAKKFKASFY